MESKYYGPLRRLHVQEMSIGRRILLPHDFTVPKSQLYIEKYLELCMVGPTLKNHNKISDASSSGLNVCSN
jgi:hypothetical protein